MPVVARAPVREAVRPFASDDIVRPPVARSPIDHSPIVDPPRVAPSQPRPHPRPIETPPRHGEKPYAQVVEEAFDGPVLTLSKKLRLLEAATNRGIRRGAALDLIAATQRKLDQRHSVRRATFRSRFAYQVAAFTALYVVIAVAWCALMSL